MEHGQKMVGGPAATLLVYHHPSVIATDTFGTLSHAYAYRHALCVCSMIVPNALTAALLKNAKGNSSSQLTNTSTEVAIERNSWFLRWWEMVPIQYTVRAMFGLGLGTCVFAMDSA